MQMDFEEFDLVPMNPPPRAPYLTREQVMLEIYGPELGAWFHRDPAALEHYNLVLKLSKQERNKETIMRIKFTSIDGRTGHGNSIWTALTKAIGKKAAAQLPKVAVSTEPSYGMVLVAEATGEKIGTVQEMAP